MSDINLRSRTIALAGIFQAVSQVRHTARHGDTESAPFSASIYSVFQLDADNVEQVYGGLAGLDLGIRTLVHELGRPRGERNLKLIRYSAGLLVLERMLSRRGDLMQQIRDGINALAPRSEGAYTADSVIAELAELYMNTVSTLTPRLMISGDPETLRDRNVANTIRALLLAGIRAAVLWSQFGGTRWTLLFSRRRYISEARSLMTEYEA